MTVCWSAAFSSFRSIGPSEFAPANLLLMILRNVKMTSCAVSGFPSWKVIPGRSLMTHSEVEPCVLIDSASTYSVCACALSWSSGW